MSDDFDAARKRVESYILGLPDPRRFLSIADIRLLLDNVREQGEEIERLKQTPMQEDIAQYRGILAASRRECSKQATRADKAEAEIERLKAQALVQSRNFDAALEQAISAAEQAEAELATATAEMKAEREGALDLRQRFGARDDETFPAFVERLAAELAAERERRERFEVAVKDIERVGCMQHGGEPFWCKKDGSTHSIYCPAGIAHEALRPAAPEPTPSEKDYCESWGLPGARAVVGSEQPDLPLGHEFVAGHPHPAYQSYCALRGIFGLCGQPESAHRRKS